MAKAQDEMNLRVTRLYRERLLNIALAQFEWHGLPDTVDPLYMETQLLEKGTVALYKEEVTGSWLATSYLSKSKGGRYYDIYGKPVAIDGIGANGEILKTDEFYILYDNRTKISLLDKIETYARTLAHLHLTFLSNLKFQNIPILLPVEDKTKLTWDNFELQKDQYAPVIRYDKSLNIQDVKPFNLQVPYIGGPLMDTLQDVWNEALSMLGITPVTTKKERLIQDEISANRQGDIVSLNGRLLGRIELANKFNKEQGYSVSVNLSSNDPLYNLGDELQGEEGDIRHGKIYAESVRNSTTLNE